MNSRVYYPCDASRVMYHSLDAADPAIRAILSTDSTLEGRGTRTVDCDSNTYLYYEVIGGYIDVRCVKVVLVRT